MVSGLVFWVENFINLVEAITAKTPTPPAERLTATGYPPDLAWLSWVTL